ncbi:hypothetical protein, partial [Rurimicrobium arvi]|uniref:hypothetical protein n=1 Tax=Rurimicrobium arvi TaxID=2049916 RepID=UPI0031CFE9D6
NRFYITRQVVAVIFAEVRFGNVHLSGRARNKIITKASLKTRDIRYTERYLQMAGRAITASPPAAYFAVRAFRSIPRAVHAGGISSTDQG